MGKSATQIGLTVDNNCYTRLSKKQSVDIRLTRNLKLDSMNVSCDRALQTTFAYFRFSNNMFFTTSTAVSYPLLLYALKLPHELGYVCMCHMSQQSETVRVVRDTSAIVCDTVKSVERSTLSQEVCLDIKYR